MLFLRFSSWFFQYVFKKLSVLFVFFFVFAVSFVFAVRFAKLSASFSILVILLMIFIRWSWCFFSWFFWDYCLFCFVHSCCFVVCRIRSKTSCYFECLVVFCIWETGPPVHKDVVKQIVQSTENLNRCSTQLRMSHKENRKKNIITPKEHIMKQAETHKQNNKKHIRKWKENPKNIIRRIWRRITRRSEENLKKPLKKHLKKDLNKIEKNRGKRSGNFLVADYYNHRVQRCPAAPQWRAPAGRAAAPHSSTTPQESHWRQQARPV